MTLEMRSCGITTAHQAAIAGIAHDMKTFIFVRPVNPDATGLIEGGFKTKALDIHAKSSDWGPMAGFICDDSSLSKVAGNLVKQQRNDVAVQQSLLHPHVGIVPLDLPGSRIAYLKDRMPDINVEDKPFVATSSSGISKTFRLLKQPTPDTYRVQVQSGTAFHDVTVIGYTGNPGQGIVPVTADYDIFAICPHHSAPGFSVKGVTTVDAQPDLGVLSAYQARIRRSINARCGGHAVVNHGTELNNPFPESDPELVMFPPDGPGSIVKRARLPAIFGDLTVRGFHVYFNALWPAGIKETIQNKMNQMKQPSRLGSVVLQALQEADFGGLKMRGYGADAETGFTPSTAGSAARFASDILNNRASAPGLPAVTQPRWRP
jgi:anthrax edema toxin adenylate cyclase